MRLTPDGRPAPESGAIISPCAKYRYQLTRAITGGSLAVLFVGLNPSTADANVDDPTIRRMKSFASALGGGVLMVGNIFSYRATDPEELWGLPLRDAVGPENDRHLAQMARAADIVIAAWGTAAARSPRASAVMRVLQSSRQGDIQCLGTTKDGWPRHPLYVRGDTPLEIYRVGERYESEAA